jgi:hypothetical protein
VITRFAIPTAPHHKISEGRSWLKKQKSNLRKKSQIGSVYQLKVTLKRISPPIWRRFQVTDDITLPKFHRILQVIMGWDVRKKG